MCRDFLSRLQLEVSTYEVTMQKCIWECFHWCLLMHSNTLYFSFFFLGGGGGGGEREVSVFFQCANEQHLMNYY